jgi:hypothetical protein
MPVSTIRTPDVTADVGGQKNVEMLQRISRDFRSAYEEVGIRAELTL